VKRRKKNYSTAVPVGCEIKADLKEIYADKNPPLPQ
jgi:hypothetical protein